ncbi:homocysteine-responsive endoplasmic reticulum-resident ubiquitin-like domain member 2 protein [Aricia agestis]|uniref:homocysteine-responsive endoplasmic reticulum-resident ubiquitin-like domain member 2 protein n=1 Tax=Aricia agestis TaxID=91739 RepID=UPI001C20854F|nr:homocysteine-responsive endoplasmic reticulum-resident ubiquitin-like domain member 2 protein [Aricia agestis]
MMTDNVTLIVKAPNQQIEDQNIQCRMSWTVGELKGHLSEVYPSKPTKEEQKIIYSGRLLDDNAVIKDILRNYEDQFTHTMHLVCAPKRNIMTEKRNEAEKTEPNTDGIRHRNVGENPNPPEPARPEVRQNDQNHTVEMQNYLSSFVNNYGRVPPYPNYNLGQGYLPVPSDPASMANHMMMMQQAYMQYMQQYANMWQATAEAAATPPPVETPPQPAPVREPEADEGRQARDWLDHIYSASRFAILISLLYVYGSPARLLLVIILAAMAYLHQVGFFRDLRNLANNDARNEAQNAGERNDQPDNDGNEEPRAEQNGNRQEQQTNEPANENDQPSLLAVTWMIFTTFFTSLIPDTN